MCIHQGAAQLQTNSIHQGAAQLQTSIKVLCVQAIKHLLEAKASYTNVVLLKVALWVSEP